MPPERVEVPRRLPRTSSGARRSGGRPIDGPPLDPHPFGLIWTRRDPGGEQGTGVFADDRISAGLAERCRPAIYTIERPDTELCRQPAIGSLVVPGHGHVIRAGLHDAGLVRLLGRMRQAPLRA